MGAWPTRDWCCHCCVQRRGLQRAFRTAKSPRHQGPEVIFMFATQHSALTDVDAPTEWEPGFWFKDMSCCQPWLLNIVDQDRRQDVQRSLTFHLELTLHSLGSTRCGGVPESTHCTKSLHATDGYQSLHDVRNIHVPPPVVVPGSEITIPTFTYQYLGWVGTPTIFSIVISVRQNQDPI